MTAPRQVLPGVSYLLTRRCLQRQFLLRPGRLVNDIFLYVLAVAADRYGILVHSFCVLSNHYHLVLTDPQAHLPAFGQFLDSLVARAVNASIGRSEVFWAPNSYSAVSLATADDILQKAIYTLANPVAAGLVKTGKLWPGAWSAPDSIGSVLEARRPDGFFDPDGQLPAVAKLRLTAPPGFESAESFRQALSAGLAEREADLRRGRSFLGVARVLKQRRTDRPASGEPRRKLRPRVAALDKWKRVETLGRLVEFLRAYREALFAWRAGELALFPAGTYLMRVLHSAPCAASG